MQIRPFEKKDYLEVCDLLISRHVEPPHEISDLNGICFVAVENDEIVGVIWALVGKSTQAHVDYVAVKEEGVKIGSQLLIRLDSELKKLGIKRYTFYIEEHSKRMLDLILKYKEQAKVKMLRKMYFFRRDL